jgi:hypothetical protein
MPRFDLADASLEVLDDRVDVILTGSPPIQASTALIRLSRSPLLLLTSNVHRSGLDDRLSKLCSALKARSRVLREKTAMLCFRMSSFSRTCSDHKHHNTVL